MKQAGFTLIEVMISMFIMLFIVQGMAMVSLYAQRSSIYARRLTSANMLAEQELERSRNIDYDNLATLNGDVSCFDGFMTPVANCAGSDAVFTRTTTVTADTPLANTSQIDVSVTWDEGLAWNARLAADGSYEAKVVSYISRY
jgi:prepilin-type N-terminal cleavage/methylation domain-containing protein